MKTLALLALLVPTLLHAATWRVNNNADYDPDFTSLQDAINAANAGDTIHVEPSPVTYGTDTLNKQLTLIGPGFKLGQGAGNNLGLQANSETAKIDWLIFMAGSEQSVVTGLHFVGPFALAQFDDATGNCVISRCYFDQGGIVFNNTTTPLSQVLITQCYFNGSALSFGSQTVSLHSNISLLNNYIFGTVALNETLVSDWTVAHNVFDGSYAITFWNTEFLNNIFADSTAILSLDLNSFSHNLAAGASTLPSGNFNVNGVDMGTIFVGTGSDDSTWQLQAGVSTTYPASDNLTERGMYGGETPYQLSGVPSVPSIYTLQTTPTAIQGATIDVNIGTRSND